MFENKCDAGFGLYSISKTSPISSSEKSKKSCLQIFIDRHFIGVHHFVGSWFWIRLWVSRLFTLHPGSDVTGLCFHLRHPLLLGAPHSHAHRIPSNCTQVGERVACWKLRGQTGQKCKQDGRLELANFSPNYKYFDQLLLAVKNETTVLNLVFKSFLQTSIPPLISMFYAREGIAQFFVKNFLSHTAEKIRRGTLRCFRKFLVSKNFIHKKGISRLSVGNFLSHNTKKFHRRTQLFSENFWYRRILCKSGGITILSKTFWLTIPRKFHRRTQLFSENFWYRRILCISGGITILSKTFWLTVPRKFVGELFCVPKNFGTKNFLAWEGVPHFTVENFLSHSTETFRRRIFLCFYQFLVSKNFMETRGISRFSVVLVRLKKVGEGWNSNPFLALQNPVVLPAVPWEQLEFLTNVVKLIKLYDSRDSNSDVVLEKCLSSPHFRDHLLENKNSWQKQSKKEIWPYCTEWIIFIAF